MANTNQKNKVTKKSVPKKVVKSKTQKKSKREIIKFNKYSIWFQSGAMILAIAALTLSLCDCIEMGVMIDLFGLSVIFLAFSLFPKIEK